MVASPDPITIAPAYDLPWSLLLQDLCYEAQVD